MKSAIRFGKQTLKCYGADQAGSFAAAIAYYTLFSIFPLSVFIIGFAGYFLSNDQRQQLVNKLTSALGGASTANVAQQVDAISHGKAGLGIIGLVGALWSASAVFAALRTGLNVVWNVKKPKAWWRQKVADLSGVVGLTLVLLLSLLSTAAVSFVSSLATRLLGHTVGQAVTVPLGLLLTVLPLGIVFLAFGALYVWASPPDIGWKHVWPGALLGAIGFVALSIFFGIYVRFFGHYDKVYGTLGAVIAFLFYAYLIGSLILFGAELTEQYVRVKREGRVPDKSACEDDSQEVAAPEAKMAGGDAASRRKTSDGREAGGILILKPAKAAAKTKDDEHDTVTVGELFPEDGAGAPGAVAVER